MEITNALRRSHERLAMDAVAELKMRVPNLGQQTASLILGTSLNAVARRRQPHHHITGPQLTHERPNHDSTLRTLADAGGREHAVTHIPYHVSASPSGHIGRLGRHDIPMCLSRHHTSQFHPPCLYIILSTTNIKIVILSNMGIDQKQ